MTEPRSRPVAFRAVRGAVWVTLNAYWSIGFGFAANVILTRQLFPEAYGTFALAMFFAQALRLQPRIGLGYAYAQRQGDRATLTATYALADAALALSGPLLSLATIPVLLALGYAPLAVQVSLALALAACAEGLSGIYINILDKDLAFGQTSLVQSLWLTVSYLPAFWLAGQGAGVWALVSQTLIYNLGMLPHLWWIARPHLGSIWRWPPLFDRKLAWEMTQYGLRVGLATLASMLMTQLDNLLVGTLVGAVALGYYDRAYRTTQWTSTLVTSLLARTGFYTYARLQDDPPRLARSVDMVLWLLTMVTFPLGLALFVTASDLVVWLYTATWLPSATLMQLLIACSIIRPFTDNAGALFIALGRPGLMTRLTLVQLVALAGLGLPFVLTWGVEGAAIAVALAYGLGFALVHREVARLTQVRVWRLLLPPVLISGVVLLGYLALNQALPVDALSLPMRVALKSLYVGVAYLGLSVAIRPADTVARVSYIWRLLRQAPA